MTPSSPTLTECDKLIALVHDISLPQQYRKDLETCVVEYGIHRPELDLMRPVLDRVSIPTVKKDGKYDLEDIARLISTLEHNLDICNENATRYIRRTTCNWVMRKIYHNLDLDYLNKYYKLSRNAMCYQYHPKDCGVSNPNAQCIERCEVFMNKLSTFKLPLLLMLGFVAIIPLLGLLEIIFIIGRVGVGQFITHLLGR